MKGQKDFQFRAIIKVSRESREGKFKTTKQNKTRADLIAKKRERERSVMNLLVPVKHISNMLILFVKKEFPKSQPMVITIQKDYCQTNGWTKLNPEIKKKKKMWVGTQLKWRRLDISQHHEWCRDLVIIIPTQNPSRLYR